MWQFKPNQYSVSCVLPFPCIHNKYIGLHLISMHWNTGICCAFAKVWPQVNAVLSVLSVLYVRIRILVWCVLVLLHNAHFHLCIYIFVFLFTVTLLHLFTLGTGDFLHFALALVYILCFLLYPWVCILLVHLYDFAFFVHYALCTLLDLCRVNGWVSDGLSRGLLAAGYTRRNIYIPVFPNIYLNYIFLVSAFVFLFIPFRTI